jgi:hypothetical protein
MPAIMAMIDSTALPETSNAIGMSVFRRNAMVSMVATALDDMASAKNRFPRKDRTIERSPPRVVNPALRHLVNYLIITYEYIHRTGSLYGRVIDAVKKIARRRD